MLHLQMAVCYWVGIGKLTDYGLFTLIGTFKLTLQFTEDYPNKPPTVRFVSRMFHPNSNISLPSSPPSPSLHVNINIWCRSCGKVVWHPTVCAVYADGSICLDILQNQWSPIYDVAAILTSIQVSSFLFIGAGMLITLCLSCCVDFKVEPCYTYNQSIWLDCMNSWKEVLDSHETHTMTLFVQSGCLNTYF